MKYSNKNVGKERSNMIPLELPKLNENIKGLMKQSFDCKKPLKFDHGIFSAARKRFGSPLIKIGFVQIIADTRMSMPGSEANLIDGNKKTNWLSTKRKNPSLTLYFPFHLLTLNAIGLRSHFEPQFKHFITDFFIEAMDDKKQWKPLLYCYTLQLSFLGAKRIYEFKINQTSIKAIRIVSTHGIDKFGFSVIELFGTAEYNENKFHCSENTFRNLIHSFCYKTNYKEISDSKIHELYEPKKTIKAALFQNKKKWEEETDFENSNNSDLYEFLIEATDKNGPSLITKYEEVTGEQISLYNPANTGLISSLDSVIVEKKLYYCLDFNFFIMEIDEIKITTGSDPKDLPKGIIIAGLKLENINEFEPYVYIAYLPEDSLEPNAEYSIKIPEKIKFTGLLLFSCSNTCPFKLQKVDIYGIGYKQFFFKDYISEKKEKRNYTETFPCLKCFPPLQTEEDEDIFTLMKKYYGPTLNGFVQVLENNEGDSSFEIYNFNESELLHSQSSQYPAVSFYFINHQISLSKIEITIDESQESKNNPIKHFVLSGFLFKKSYRVDDIILFDGKLDFTNNNTVTIDLNGDLFDIIYLASDYPFFIRNVKFFGHITPKEFELKNDLLTRKTKIKEKVLGYIEENRKAKIIKDKTLQKQKIEQSIKGYQEKFVKELNANCEFEGKTIFTCEGPDGMDIMEYGITTFEHFHVFSNIGGDKNYSLYHRNFNNVWVPKLPNDSVFIISFHHHAVKLTGFNIVTAKDKQYEPYMPNAGCLYGYNATAKRWEVLYNIFLEAPMKIGTRYTFQIEIHKTHIFNHICFFTYSEHLALSCFQLFGDLIETDIPLDPSIQARYPQITFNSMPALVSHLKNNEPCLGIFRMAASFFGIQLKNFVQIYCEKESDNIKDEFVWTDSVFKAKSSTAKNPKELTFYFPNHVFYIEGFMIQPAEDCVFTNFAVGSSLTANENSQGIIISLKKNFKWQSNNMTSLFLVQNLNNDTRPCRIVRFFGLEKDFAFKYLDLIGIAIPSESKPLTKSDLKKIQYPPELYNEMVIIEEKKVVKSDTSKKKKKDKNKESKSYDKPPLVIEVELSKKDYICKYCGTFNRSPKNLLSDRCNKSPTGYHKIFNGNVGKYYSCKYCGSSFHKISDMSKERCRKSPTEYHVPYAGEYKSAYLCKFCAEQFCKMSNMCDIECRRSPNHFHVPYAGEYRKYYECKYCGEKYYSLKTLCTERCKVSPYKFHIPYPGPTKDQYICKYCGAKEKSLKDLCTQRCRKSPYDSHVPATITDKDEYPCKYCGVYFDTIRKMKRDGECFKSPYGIHIPYVGENKTEYICKFCGYCEDTIGRLTRDECTKSPKGHHVPYGGEERERYFCKYCGFWDDSIRRLTRDECYKSPNGYHVPFTAEERQGYLCKYCGDSDYNIMRLTRDECTESPNGYHVPYSGDDNKIEFMCKYCGEYYESIRKLTMDECTESPNGYHVPHTKIYYK